MKKKVINILLLCITFLVITPTFGQDLPMNNGTLVNDFANIIPDDQELSLRKIVKDYENKTSIQMCIVTVSSLDGKNIEDYANSLFKKWGIGQKGLNNGLLILVAPNERKWRIEVGYGLEEWITDSYSKSVGELNFKPNFKKGDYYSGIKNAITNFIGTLGQDGWAQRQEYVALKKKKNDEELQTALTWTFSIILLLLTGVVFLIIYRRNQKEKQRIKDEEEREQRLAREAEIKRLAKIESAKKKHSIIKQEFDKVKNRLDSLENKNFTGYDDMTKKLDTLQQKTLTVLSLNPNVSTETDSIIREFDYVSSGLKSILDELSENDKIISKVNYAHTKHLEVISDINMTAVGVETMLNKMHQKYSEIKPETVEQNFKSKIDTSLTSYKVCVLNSKKHVDSGDFKKAKECFELAEQQLKYANSCISSASSIQEKVKSADNYLNRSKQTLAPFITASERLCSDSDVETNTKNKLKSAIKEASLFNPALYSKNPLSGQVILNNLINNIEAAISKAKREISNAEEVREREARRIKREREEEEDRIRQAAAASYSTSSYSSSSDYSSSSSSSSDSSSDFGGGDSGGGGSSGDW